MSVTRANVRPLFVILGSLALSAGAAAAAQPAPSAAATTAPIERSPFFGQWELDLSRMPETYGPPPKRVTFTFQDIGSDMWRTSVEIIGQDDSVRHAVVRYCRDGRAVQGEGDRIDGDRAAFLSPAPFVRNFHFRRVR